MVDALVGNDLVINEDSCNLSCAYCLTGQSNLKQGHSQQLIFQPPKTACYAKGEKLDHNLKTTIGRIKDSFGAPYLKVTGGEIMDFLKEMSSCHEVLVVQTNGMLVKDEHLQAFLDWGNVVIQISLDSHLYEGNSYRVPDRDVHDRLMARITAILESGLPTEIYGVINDRSVGDLTATAEWLTGFKKPPVYTPFPVRGPDAADFKIRDDQIVHIENLVARFDEFRSVLGPRAYFNRLLSFYRHGERRYRCHLSRLVISSFSDGVVTACPNIWFSQLGNAVEGDWEAIARKVGKTGLYQALLSPRPRLDACKGCFTPWDVLSMYVDGEITADELAATPAYASPGIRNIIDRYRAEVGAADAAIED